MKRKKKYYTDMACMQQGRCTVKENKNKKKIVEMRKKKLRNKTKGWGKKIISCLVCDLLNSEIRR